MRNRIYRQQSWGFMRANASGFTVKALVVAVPGMTRRQAFGYLNVLEQAGYLARQNGLGARKPTGQMQEEVYQLVRNTGPLAPYSYEALRDPNKGGAAIEALEQQVWVALRVARRARVSELETMTGGKYIMIARYLKYLCRIGYVRVESKRRKQRTDGWVWELVKDTGPVAPLFEYAGNGRNPKRAWDGNLSKWIDRECKGDGDEQG